MSLLVVGTVAFDSIETPFGKKEKILGGAATYTCIILHILQIQILFQLLV